MVLRSLYRLPQEASLLLRLEDCHERLSSASQFSLQTRGAIAAVARPCLLAIGVPALSPVMRVLDFGQVEMLLPIWTLLLKWRRTVANFDPPSRAIRAEPGVAHIA